MNRVLTAIFMTLSLVACSNSQPTKNDPCSGSTEKGARQKFTFEAIVSCLDTAEKVSAFMANNIEYDIGYDMREQSGNEYTPAAVIYERGIDDADGHAILQCYFLEMNGWDAFVIGLSIESPVGSNVCGILTDDGSLLALAGGGVTQGPFDSFSSLARFYIELDWMESGGTLRTIKASQINQIITDHTAPAVLELPWVYQQY